MEAIKKIIGLIIIIGIIILLINARKFLPSLGNFAVGGTSGTKSPLQIGTDYMTQIERMTPKVGGGAGYGQQGGRAIGYGSFNPYAYGATSYGGAGGTGAATSPISTTGSRATLERNGGQLVLYVENVRMAAGTSARIWLTNTPTISDQTEYVDFGPVRSGTGVITYAINLRSGDLDLSVFRYLMILDPKTFQIHAMATLGR